jgi:rhomboid family GlyGly-CTERM serine protease
VSRASAAWLALHATLAALAAVLWFTPRELLDWQPARAAAEPWRAWSAALVHWSPRHLGANLIGCAVVAAFGVGAEVPLRAALALLLAWPLSHAALAIEPALASYGGLSGVLHAGVAIVAWHLAHTRGRQRAIGIAVAAGLALKLLTEAPWAAPLRLVAGWDFPVAPLAHATGAGAGLACAWLIDVLRRPAA